MTFQNAALAYAILRLLTHRFTDFDAYKLGIIDDTGRQLKKPTTDEEKAAWSILTRIAVRLKRVIQTSGSGHTLASIAAAYWLVKESYTSRTLPSSEVLLENFTELLESSEKYFPVEEMCIIEAYLREDIGAAPPGVPTNNTSEIAGEHEPVITPKRAKKYREFNVTPDLMSRFSRGKTKFSRWDSYINMEDLEEREIYEYAKSNPKSIIVLKNGDQIRGIRFSRHGSGNWHHIKRKPKGITEDVHVEFCNLNVL